MTNDCLRLSTVAVLCWATTVTQQQSNDLSATLRSVGGEQFIRQLPTMQIDSDGVFYEFMQSNADTAHNYVINEYQLRETMKLAWSSPAMLRWDMNNHIRSKVFPYDGSITLVINGAEGYMEGAAWKIFNPTQQTNSSLGNDAMMALVKTELMANPLAMLHHYLSNPGGRNGTVLTLPPLLSNLCMDCPSITLQLDSVTQLPTRAQTLEGHDLLGDVVFDVEYFNWTNFGNVMYPQKIVHRLGGWVIRRDNIKQVQFLQNYDYRTIFNVLTKSNSQQNPEATVRGYKQAQSISRSIPNGVTTTAIFDLLTVEPVGGKLYKCGTLQQFYVSLIYDAPEGLYVIEAPVSNQRSEVMIDAIRRRFGSKKIVALVVSHLHSDHSGGIRGLAPYVDKIYIARENAAYLMDLLHHKPTVVSDALSRNPRENIDVIGVSDFAWLSNGPDMFMVLRMKSSTHAADMMHVYFPQLKMHVSADVANIGMAAGLEKDTPRNRRTFIMYHKQLFKDIASANLDVERHFAIHGGEVPKEEVLYIAGQSYDDTAPF